MFVLKSTYNKALEELKAYKALLEQSLVQQRELVVLVEQYRVREEEHKIAFNEAVKEIQNLNNIYHKYGAQ